MLTLRIQDEKTSKRSKDANGFLIIKDNPIAKAGVFDYLLSELKQDIEPKDDKVVKVYRPFSELIRIKESFANKPIKMNHHWVGDECETADGAIGSNITIDEANEYLRADLIIYNPKLIEAIETNELVELSPAYTGKEIAENGRYNGEAYEYKQELGEVNHLAVVEIGRSGKDLKIYDDKSRIGDFMRFKDRLMERFSKFLDSEIDAKADEECKEDETLDKREIIKEIMAISAKPVEEFEGGEDEKVETIAKLAEKLAYYETADEDETEKKADSDEEAEEQKADEETQGDKVDIDEVAEAVAEVVEKVTEQKLKEFADSQRKEAKKISDAYSEVKKALGGDFDSSNMSVAEIYQFGYEALSNSKLDKKLDSKTAFLMALDSKKQATHHKTSDSESISSNILKLLKEKY
ncbi:DUF2213 domain-containing protein [Campylobacter lanienae]|uniref:DUF2213 domain-containing protein n=1 Tax=Campylobacter lanienae TaxID=75658 RepID=UPI002431BEE5|nr:DUF2213 domain-containing protein [Campylobacter lanienae]MDD5786020.1 DUF2213 domain-containing protein [Campylobacter lanienae]